MDEAHRERELLTIEDTTGNAPQRSVVVAESPAAVSCIQFPQGETPTINITGGIALFGDTAAVNYCSPEVKEEFKETRKKVEQIGEKFEKKLEEIQQQLKDKGTTKSRFGGRIEECLRRVLLRCNEEGPMQAFLERRMQAFLKKWNLIEEQKGLLQVFFRCNNEDFYGSLIKCKVLEELLDPMEERSGPPFLEEKGLLQVLHRRKEEGPKHPFLRAIDQRAREERLRQASKEPSLSELMNDYNFVKKLENQLECAPPGTMKDLLFALGFSYEESCKILNPSTANLAFFEHLSKCRPDLTLQNLRDGVERAMRSRKMSIFSKLDEDILKGSVSITLESTLGELSAVPKDWQYILERVAGNLIPKKGTMLPSWEDLAFMYGYTKSDIDYFELHNKDHAKSPLQKALSLLCARENPPTVSLFVDKLRQIKREDAALMVEGWLLNRIEKKLASEEE